MKVPRLLLIGFVFVAIVIVINGIAFMLIPEDNKETTLSSGSIPAEADGTSKIDDEAPEELQKQLDMAYDPSLEIREQASFMVTPGLLIEDVLTARETDVISYPAD